MTKLVSRAAALIVLAAAPAALAQAPVAAPPSASMPPAPGAGQGPRRRGVPGPPGGADLQLHGERGHRFTISLDDDVKLPDGAILRAGYRGVGEVVEARDNGMLRKKAS